MTVRAALDPALGDRGVSPLQAAHKIGCDRSRVYKLVKRGLLRAYRDGGALRIWFSSIEDYQRRDPVLPDPDAAGLAAPKPHSAAKAGAEHLEAVAALQALGIMGQARR
jgi:excisionase family DNA binding protein